ncbi:tetratricopeptide repeat protein [Kribbella sp. NPDC050124]|uniref:tetratricopeptide repeat protein n=1 Tax=Kribbella sp. NPDC050124 TaxID=3364114 RepID=UPI003792828F
MAHVAVPAVISAATQLMRAARWTDATDLLRAAATDDPADRRALALARAEVAVDQDFAQQTSHAPAALAAASQALENLPDATNSWDLRMLHLRKDYSDRLFGPRDEAGDRTTGAELSGRVVQLRDDAADDSRRGLASFYAGVIADNLLGDHEEAFGHYKDALALGERASDDLLVSLALRHLGDHAHTAGDLQGAREQWERSTELRQQVGHLLGALAQQTLLAVLLKDEGDVAGSRALATEINRWSNQVGLTFISKQTAELMSSDAKG